MAAQSLLLVLASALPSVLGGGNGTATGLEDATAGAAPVSLSAPELDCDVDFGIQPPLYLVAAEGALKLVVMNFVFPPQPLANEKMSLPSFMLAGVMSGLAVSTTVHDIMYGWRYLTFAMGFTVIAIPILLFAFFNIICYFCSGGEKLFGYVGALVLLALPVVAWIVHGMALDNLKSSSPETFREVNCESLRWTSSAQIPGFVQSLAILWASLQMSSRVIDFKNLHWMRSLTLILFWALNVIYVPVMFATLCTHILTGIFLFFPVTLIIVLLVLAYCYALYKVFVVEETLNPREQALLEAEETKKTRSWYENLVASVNLREIREERALREEEDVRFYVFWIRASAVPVVLIWKFYGEAVVKYRMGFPWWDAILTTWGERTLIKYVTHLFESAEPWWNILHSLL